MRMLTRIVAVGIVITGTHSASSADVLDQFHARYRSLKSVKMRFVGSDGISGLIVAQRGGRYRIEIGTRTIVCNGRTVWNADATTKSVIMNTYKPLSSDVSLERVFFEIISVYRSSIVEQSPITTVLRLTAPQPAAVIANVSALDLTLDKAGNVSKVVIVSGPSRVTYAISGLKTNPPISSSEFTYVVPKRWELVDLR